MSNALPRFRPEINVTVQNEENETYLILHDPFGFAEGPIMIHADMVDILEHCDGITTWDELASSAGADPDGQQMLKVRAFVGQLSELGYLDSEEADRKRANAMQHWNSLASRPTVCAGSTYPEDPDELQAFLEELIPANKQTPYLSPITYNLSPITYNLSPSTYNLQPRLLLLPHIDFRVAPSAYAAGFNMLRTSDAEVFVMIGTSHYWSGGRVVLTNKHFATPLGDVQTDQEIVNALRQAIDPNHCEASDLAHKPEHSLELHVVGLKHLFQNRPFTIVPILVTGIGGAEDPTGFAELAEIASQIHRVVSESGKKALFLVSGDLSHIGRKFGDALPSENLLDETQRFDRILLNLLEGADPAAVHACIEESDYKYRVCGHSPAVLALQTSRLAVGDLKGETLGYDVWNEAETQSSVSFATVAWYQPLTTDP